MTRCRTGKSSHGPRLRRLAVELLWCAALVCPSGAAAQKFDSISFNGRIPIGETGGYGIKVAISHSKDVPRPAPMGPALAPNGIARYVQVSETVDWAFYVDASGTKEFTRGAGKYMITVKGQVMAGRQSGYSLQLPEAAYRAMRRRRGPRPNPFKPETLPVNASVLLTRGQFVGTGLEVVFQEISLQVGHRDVDGLAIGLTKNSPTQVEAMIGPYHAVVSNLFGAIGIDAGIASLWVGQGAKAEKSAYRLKSAVFDLGSKEGRDAFRYFFVTGRMDQIAARKGVVRYGEIRETQETDTWYSQIQAGVGGFQLTLGSVDMSIAGSKRVARYNTGYRRVDEQVREDTRTVIRRVVGGPGRASKERFLVLLPGVWPVTAAGFANLFGSVRWVGAGLERDLPTKQPSSYDLQLEFTRAELAELQRRAERCYGSEACHEHIRAYDAQQPGHEVSRPYLVISKSKILQWLARPIDTHLDRFAPSRIVVPFLRVHPFLMSAALHCLRPGAEGGTGATLPGRLLIVAHGRRA